MPAISYCKETIEKYDFENKILDGRKKHTIRRYRKRPFKLNDDLFHYKNWRTPQVQKITENICLYVADIKIELYLKKILIVYVNGKTLYLNQYKQIAINDGFNDYFEFHDFFIKSGLPFHGQIIGWIEGIDYT